MKRKRVRLKASDRAGDRRAWLGWAPVCRGSVGCRLIFGGQRRGCLPAGWRLHAPTEQTCPPCRGARCMRRASRGQEKLPACVADTDSLLPIASARRHTTEFPEHECQRPAQGLAGNPGRPAPSEMGGKAPPANRWRPLPRGSGTLARLASVVHPGLQLWTRLGRRCRHRFQWPRTRAWVAEGAKADHALPPAALLPDHVHRTPQRPPHEPLTSTWIGVGT